MHRNKYILFAFILITLITAITGCDTSEMDVINITPTITPPATKKPTSTTTPSATFTYTPIPPTFTPTPTPTITPYGFYLDINIDEHCNCSGYVDLLSISIAPVGGSPPYHYFSASGGFSILSDPTFEKVVHYISHPGYEVTIAGTDNKGKTDYETFFISIICSPDPEECPVLPTLSIYEDGGGETIRTPEPIDVNTCICFEPNDHSNKCNDHRQCKID